MVKILINDILFRLIYLNNQNLSTAKLKKNNLI